MLEKVTPARLAASDPQRVMRDPAFQRLVQERSRFGWSLSAIMLVVYLGFIFAVAFAPEVMATKIGGGPTSLGIVLGLCVILFAFALTGVYVVRANGRFDELTRDVTGEQP